MIEYFNNRPFTESIPGMGNSRVKPDNASAIVYLLLATAAGMVVGYFIQQMVNEKRTAMIIEENEKLKNR